jgi:ParB-like chromosome segregation protein Spo0J
MDQSAVLRELKANLGLPWEKLAQKLGLTKRRVLDLVGLLDLPEEIKEDIRQKKLTERHGRALRQL